MAVIANRRSVMTLFSNASCPQSHRVRIVLAEKGITVEIANVDPDNLPEGAKTDMDFGKDKDAKAWKDIWGAGQGVGDIDETASTREVVLKMEQEYKTTLAELTAA